MNVLGIHYGSSDAGVCVISGDRKPIAVALERLDRIKYSGEVTPGWQEHYQAKIYAPLDYCARGLGVDAADLRFDIVVHTVKATDDETFRAILAPYTHAATVFHELNHPLSHAASAYFA